MKRLDEEQYVNLITFRKDGTEVRTPVWFAEVRSGPDEGKLGVFTNVNSYKVKRLRNDQRVRVAACNGRGKVHGDWLDGTGELIDDSSRADAVYEALGRKYGLLWSATSFFGKLTGRAKQWQTLVVDLDAKT